MQAGVGRWRKEKHVSPTRPAPAPDRLADTSPAGRQIKRPPEEGVTLDLAPKELGNNLFF